MVEQGMMTSSNGSVFRVTNPLWRESIGHRWFPSQRPVTWSFVVFFDLCLNKQLSQPSRRWWFETPSRSLWRLCNSCSQFDRGYRCNVFSHWLRFYLDMNGKRAMTKTSYERHGISYQEPQTNIKKISQLRHDDVIKWKLFPRNWPFVWGIHRSPVNSLHNGQWHGALMFLWSTPE